MQKQISSARLQPMAPTFRKIERIAKETAQATNKFVSIHFEGGNITLDKYILDALQNPLLQLNTENSSQASFTTVPCTCS